MRYLALTNDDRAAMLLEPTESETKAARHPVLRWRTDWEST